MIVAVPLLLLVLGLLAGWLIRRWTFVAVVTLLGLAISVIGWLTGWAASQDTLASSGAFFWAILFWGPFAAGTALGVCLRRAAGEPPRRRA